MKLKEINQIRPLLRDPTNPRAIAAISPLLRETAQSMLQEMDSNQVQQLTKFFVKPSTALVLGHTQEDDIEKEPWDSQLRTYTSGEKAEQTKDTPECKIPKTKQGKEYPKGYFLRK